MYPLCLGSPGVYISSVQLGCLRDLRVGVLRFGPVKTAVFENMAADPPTKERDESRCTRGSGLWL